MPIKYLHLFEREDEFTSAYTGVEYNEPWISFTEENKKVGYNKTEDEKYLGTPLTFEIVSGGTLYWMANHTAYTKTIQYSKNGGEWTSITSSQDNGGSGTTICSVVAGDIVEFRGKNNYYVNNGGNGSIFKCTEGCYFYVYGNIMSMVNYENFRTNTSLMNSTGDNQVLGKLFFDNKGLLFKDDKSLMLPGIGNGMDYAYINLFHGTSNINTDKIKNASKVISRSMFSQSEIDDFDFNDITDIYRSAFSDCTNLTIDLKAPSLNYIGYSAFRRSGIRKVSNLGHLTELPDSGHDDFGIFAGCTGLTEVVLPPTLTQINNRTCFMGCTSLRKINLENLTYVANSVFNNCILLDNETGDIALPSLTSIGRGVFRNCHSIKRIINLGHITEIPDADGGFCRECSGLTEVWFPNELTQIGNMAFWHTYNLSKVHWNSNAITKIGANAFDGCKLEIDDLNLPNLTTLGAGAFASHKIKKITSLGTITTIGNSTFKTNSQTLTEVTLPATLTSIGNEVFWNNDRDGVLTTVTCLATTPPTLGGNCFQRQPNLSAIYVPAESVDLYKAANNWSAYSSIIQAIPSN